VFRCEYQIKEQRFVCFVAVRAACYVFRSSKSSVLCVT